MFPHYLKLFSRNFYTHLETVHKSLFVCVFNIIGSSNLFACGSELHNSLTSEIRFLRKQNQALNTLLAKGPRGKTYRASCCLSPAVALAREECRHCV